MKESYDENYYFKSLSATLNNKESFVLGVGINIWISRLAISSGLFGKNQLQDNSLRESGFTLFLGMVFGNIKLKPELK